MRNVEIQLPPQTRREAREIDGYLAEGIDEDSVTPYGTVKTKAGIELYLPTLSNFHLALHRVRIVRGADLMHLAVYSRDQSQPGYIWPIRNIYPEAMRVVEEHDSGFKVGVLGYVAKEDDREDKQLKNVAAQLRLEITSETRNSLLPEEDFFIQTDIEHYPKKVDVLALRLSPLQGGLLDKRNFILIAEDKEALPVRLKYVPNPANSFGQWDFLSLLTLSAST